MNRRFRAISVPIAILIALGTAPLLSGCVGNPVEGLVNGAVKEATGGSVSLGGELPEGWPAEVPVVDGEILFGGGGSAEGEQGWVVTIKSASADPLADARKQLEEGGFSSDAEATASGGDAGAVAMKNANFTVLVAGNADGVLYTVGVTK